MTTAHRNSTLRFWLAVAAAVDAGALIAIVGGWTPGRAAVAGAGLGLGAIAALSALVLMGTTRPIGRRLGTAMSLALMVSLLAPMAAGSISDPTQARIPDLALAVTCTAAPDAQSFTADVDFTWHKLDLWPGGAAGSSGIDALTVYAELPGWIDDELGMPPQAGPATIVSLQSMGGPWAAASTDPISQTLDGRPVGGLITAGSASADSIFGPEAGSSPGSASAGIANAALRTGGRYSLTWTFQRDTNYSPETPGRDLLPIVVVEYSHLERFMVQAFGSCADPSHTWPDRFAEWLGY